MNNNELNEAVARKLGWEPAEKEELANDIDPMQGYVKMTPGWKRNGTPQWWPNLPAYSTSIAAAWEILTYCYADLDLKYALTQNPSTLKVHCLIGYTEISADTAPRAICEAFLKLKEKP